MRKKIRRAESTLVGSRTPNLLIRSQALYPIELRAHSQRGGTRKIEKSPAMSSMREDIFREILSADLLDQMGLWVSGTPTEPEGIMGGETSE